MLFKHARRARAGSDEKSPKLPSLSLQETSSPREEYQEQQSTRWIRVREKLFRRNNYSKLSGLNGIASLFFTWVHITWANYYYVECKPITEIWYLFTGPHPYFSLNAPPVIHALLFLLSSVIAFLYPLGSIIQLGATAFYIYSLRVVDYSLAVGFYIGIIASLMGLLSFAKE